MKETVKKIAELSQLALTPQEEDLFASQIGHILDYVGQLKEVDTEGVAPLVTATDMAVTLREDKAERISTPDEILANAPEKSGHLFKVPPVL